jgi:ADP-ribose pyrophosphatase
MKKWELVSKKDISPHKYFPLEMRSYRMPNGKMIEEFSVTTLDDVAMIVAITKDKKVVLVNQYKPGFDDVILEFPAGRKESHHENLIDTAQKELHEETGIVVEKNSLIPFAILSGFTTKSSEKVHFFFVSEVEITHEQKFDENENIEVVILSFDEMEEYIKERKIIAAQTIAGWYIAKNKFAL